MTVKEMGPASGASSLALFKFTKCKWRSKKGCPVTRPEDAIRAVG